MQEMKKRNLVSKFLLAFAAVMMMTLAMGIPSKAANAPAQVTGVKQTAAGTNYISLEWNALLDNGVDYEVWVSTSLNGTYTCKKENTYGNETSIYGLNAGTTYYVKVKAFIKEYNTPIVEGAFSAPVEAITAPNSKTSTIKHTKSTTSSISLSWNSVPGANCYIIDYGKMSDDRNNYKTKVVNGTSITLKGLSRNQEYSVYVYSARKNSQGAIAYGPYSYKQGIPVTPGKAGSLYCPYYWEGSGQIKVECGNIYSADGYQWELYTSYKGKDTKIKSVTSNGDNTYISNSNLKKHRFYKVRVRAFCKDSKGKKYYGAWSDWKQICQQPDMKMKNTSKGIKASWDKIDGADQYIVYVSNKQTSGYKKYCTTKNTSVTVSKYGRSKLKSGRKYYMYVVAKNKVGSKYYSGEAGNASSCWYITYRK